MSGNPETIKAEIASTRAHIEDVVDELEQKLVLTKQEVKQRFSIRSFIRRHRVALALPPVLLACGTVLLVLAARRTWPVRLYLGVRTLGAFARR
jgi:hypothetical protein